ncbi:hypothetical protein, partial [Streptomyces albogriseolus]|uniref:hypothetical protein n=1 Tax=Streptomyces albogriseolus TaxID=1887 RepID=UPI00367BBAE6
PEHHPQLVRHQTLNQIRHARLNERSRHKKRRLRWSRRSSLSSAAHRSGYMELHAAGFELRHEERLAPVVDGSSVPWGSD